MKKLRALFLGMVPLLAAITTVGCEETGDPIRVDPDRTVEVFYVTTPPDTAEILNATAWDQAKEVSIRVGEEALYTNHFGRKIVRVRAVSDNEYLYMRFSWTDTTRSVRPNYWIHHAVASEDLFLPDDYVPQGLANWERLERQYWVNEDMLGLIIDYGQNGTEKANCATTCHGALNDLDTNTVGNSHWTTGGGEGRVDVWVWRAGRTDPLGLAEDQSWTAETPREDSKAVNAYNLNGLDEPRYEHKDGPDYKGDFLFSEDTLGLRDTLLVAWLNGFSLGGIPGYVLERDWNPGAPASTSKYDVRAKSEYGAGKWTVVLWRKLETPYSNEDVLFEVGNEYEMSLAVMDRTNRRHSGSKPFNLKF